MLTFSYQNAWIANYSGTSKEIGWLKKLFTYQDMSDTRHKKKFGYFPSVICLGPVMSHGQVIHAVKQAKAENISFNIEDPNFRYMLETGPIQENYLPNITARNYQLLAAQIALGKGHGLVKMATGAGKTVTFSLVVKTLIEKTDVPGILILILSKDLLNQTARRFESYGIDPDLIGIIHSDIPFEKQKIAAQKRIVLSTHLSITKFQGVIEKTKYVICDEAAHATGPMWSALFPMLPNLSNILGFTATPWDSEGERQKMIAVFGQMLVDIPAKWLIQQEILIKPEVFFIRLYYKDRNKEVLKAMDWRQAEKQLILEEKNRNLLPIVVLRKFGGRMLVIYDKLAHGETLLNLYKENGYDTRLAEGKTSTKDRESAITWFEKDLEPGQQGKVLLASRVFDEGVDIKGGCDLGFLVGAGKDPSRTKQRLGRLLRQNKTGKVMVFDVQDSNHTILSRWAGIRRNAILEETGIDPTVISLEDFMKL
jgi:superfamily II DNA or RNA helicase